MTYHLHQLSIDFCLSSDSCIQDEDLGSNEEFSVALVVGVIELEVGLDMLW